MERDDPIAGLRRALAVSRPDADFGLLRRAYEVAAECHDGQLRKSGDPYISHPVMVATILAGLGADDLTLCAALLHSTVRYTPFTLTGLRRKFGSKIGAMVAGHWTLDQISGRPMVRARDVVEAIGSADGPVAALSMADLLHNMRTVEFHPAPKQLRKARDALDIYAPAAQRLSMNALGTELRNLAFGTLVRSQPARPPTRRIIMALDIERSTSRLDPVKGELRIMLYELFDAALRTAD